MGLRLFLLLLLSTSSLSAQTISRVEYFFDIDPGFGNGTVIPITNAANIAQGFTIPLGSVSEGFHTLYIRAKDNNGLWSLPVIYPVYVQLSAQSASVTPLTRIEYFFNTDPGIGNGIEIPVTAAINITRNFTIPLSTIPEGFNTLYIRAKDSNGLWSIPVIQPVFVQRNAQSAATPALKTIEYFLDTDPGFGNGTQLALASNTIEESFVINLTSIPEGFHILYLRTEDVNGRWSLPLARPFYSANGGSEIVAVEYFYSDVATQTPSEPRTFTNFPPAANLTLDFNAVLDGLMPDTNYEIRVTAIDNVNKRSKQAVHAFATPAVICDPISPPAAVNATSCSNTSVMLTASGASATQSYQWYTSLTDVNAIAGVTVSTFQTPILTDTTEYFVTIQNGTCESDRVQVTAFINPVPAAPTTIDNEACGINATITLTSSGGSDGEYRWYEVATGGTAIAGETNAAFTTPALSGTTNYYVAINNGSCESNRSLVTATINPLPTAPTTISADNCGSGTVTLNASGGVAGQYRWYTEAIGGSAIVGQTNAEYSTPTLTATTNYFVAINNGVCESNRTIVTATINTIPTGATTTGASICGSGTVALNATGGVAGQYRWYTEVTGGTAIAAQTDAAFTTPTLTVTTNYYVSINNGTCESIRTIVTATINPLPTAPTTTGASICEGGNVTLNASGGSSGQYRWYTTATGGSAIAGQTNEAYTTPPLTSTTNYYVAINNGTCESIRTIVAATIHPNPAQPIVLASITPLPGNTLTICSTDNLTLRANDGFSAYTWSNGETTKEITVTTSGAYAVTVTDTEGCISSASDVITITVVPSPCTNSAPVINTTTLSTTIGNTVSIDLSTLISDADNNLVLSSLIIVQQPTSGAQASLNGTTLQINYSGNSFTGIDVITIRVCDVFGECTTQQLQINVIGEIEIFNGVSHNNDGKNDFFRIQNIELLEPENTLTIYNRWGSKVFETENYSEVNAFRGLTNNGNELPSGTYFYKILLKSTGKTETGYLVLKK